MPFDDAFVAELRGRKSFEVPMDEMVFDDFRRPRNPRGRTGMEGRGGLGKWGPNHAADPIVTRFDPASGRLQATAVTRIVLSYSHHYVTGERPAAGRRHRPLG